MKWKSLLLAISFATVGSTAFSSDAATKKIEGFKTPESVLVFKDGRLFVSEINEFGKDGDGQISEITRDGKVEVFASGLDDPKGMALIGKDIYVADKTRILKITPDGKWSVFTNSEAFPVKPLFLNDLASDNEGNLYVSETGNLDKGNGGAIYRINRDGKVTLTLNASDDPRVLGPNGIVVNDDRKSLLYIDFFSGSLYSVDLNTKVLTEQAKGFGGGDGLVRTKEGVIYVSDWKMGKYLRSNTARQL